MLTEIYCESFGSQKRIPFFAGLNVIQGVGGDVDNGSGNSIGKSSMLKIIDYAFGGKYYAASNEDIIRHVGDHEICFTHVFNGIPYYFKRSASKEGTILQCENSTYTPMPRGEMSSKKFCEWLIKQYKLEELQLSFREMVGLYTRVWNKPNKEVNRPLYNHNAQTVENVIISLVKLFGEYTLIHELDENNKYLRKRAQILSNAVSYHILAIPSPKDITTISRELDEIQKTIAQLKENIALTSIGNAEQLTDSSNILFDQRENLLAQRGRIKRNLKRCMRNIRRLCTVDEATFDQLIEFFPEIDIQRVKKVQDFHDSLCCILRDELNNEAAHLKQLLDKINATIEKNEVQIQELTGLPTQAEDAMDQLSRLSERKAQLQAQIDLYNDRAAEKTQSAQNREQLVQLLGQITSAIEKCINARISEYSSNIMTSNSKAPTLHLSYNKYNYGVEDNTGTGKAYTDLLLFDLAVLSLTKLPILIHDSFLFNNIDDLTKQSFIRLYSQFNNKQIFISLDQYLGTDSEEIDQILYSSTRLVLSGNEPLFGMDWRT